MPKVLATSNSEPVLEFYTLHPALNSCFLKCMVIKNNKYSLITAFLNFIKYVRACSLCIGIYVRGRKSSIEFQVSI